MFETYRGLYIHPRRLYKSHRKSVAHCCTLLTKSLQKRYDQFATKLCQFTSLRVAVTCEVKFKNTINIVSHRWTPVVNVQPESEVVTFPPVETEV